MRVEVPLRWGDLDAQGHVNNARFIDYLQDARADFLYEVGLAHLLRDGFSVRLNQIEYHAPVFFSTQPLQVEVSVCALDAGSVTLAYQLYQADRTVAAARTVLGGYDVETRSQQPLPVDARETFASLVEPAEPLREIAWTAMNERAKVSSMKVRWSDVDAYGHVNNAMIFDYIQEGRITFTAAPLRGMDDAPAPDHMWLLARQDVRYLNPVTFRKNPYVVRTGVAHMGRTSVTFSSQVDDPDTGVVCAQAGSVAVFADVTGKPAPLTDQLRATLGVYSLDPAHMTSS